jgi:4-amino-4-deoxy-L-arabinose transferase-like glycosyltransferase
MWEFIYRAVRVIVLLAVFAALAVVVQAALGGPLLLWGVVMAGLAGLAAFAWQRSGGALLQSLVPPTTLPKLAETAEVTPAFAPSQEITLAPAPPNVLGKLSELSQGFFRRLESEPTTAASAISPTATPWHVSLKQALFFISLGLAVVVAVGLRFFKLDTLQAEPYGDINIVHEYLFAIRDGEWPLEFILSSGPLYHYLIYPLVQLLGQSYSSIKVASVITSLFALLFTYLVARRLLNDWFAAIALFVAGVSSWLLVFSRLGNSQVLLPLLTMASLWLMLRFKDTGRSLNLILSAVVSALGLYVYPQSFPLPVAMFLVLVVFKLSDKQNKTIGWVDVLQFCGTAILVAAPLPFIISESMLSVNKYILPKLTDSAAPVSALLTNILNAVLAFHVQGDKTFRSNPAELPHLDPISGALMVIGFVFWLRKDRVLSLALLIPFILLQVPSVLVLTNTLETPSASRTLGVAPIAYIWVASGAWWLLQLLRQRTGLSTAFGVGVIGLAAILGWNVSRYFDSYLNGLPYQNTHIARHIQRYADTLSPDTHVYMVGCCWEGGMPEPKSISFEMKRPENLQYVDPQSLTCESLRGYVPGSVFVWPHTQPAPSPFVQAGACMPLLPTQAFFSEKGLPMYNLGVLQSGVPNSALNSPLPLPAPTELPGQLVTLDGGEVEIRHSALDIGQVQDALDKNPQTLMRGQADNPFVINLTFRQPRTLSGVALTLGSMTDVIFNATFVLEDGRISDATLESTTLPPDPRVELILAEGAQSVAQIQIEILDRRPPPGEGFHTHVREIDLIP